MKMSPKNSTKSWGKSENQAEKKKKIQATVFDAIMDPEIHLHI